MRFINGVMIGVLGMLIVAGCGQTEEKVNSVHKIAVEVEPISRGDITIYKAYSGTLEGARQSKVWASISERVIDLPKSEGSYVKAGEPIIVLDKDGAASKYNQARAVYLNSEDNFNKMKNLYELRAISEMDFKAAKTSYEVAQADFQAAKASVELSVPINGIINEIAVNVGDLAPMGMPLATVSNTEKMRLTIHVVVDVMDKLKVGQIAEVSTNSLEPIDAVIAEISRSADPETRLFRIELEMDNHDGLLRPGMYAKARVVVEKRFDVLTINKKAVFSEEGIPKAYYIENDIAYIKTLETGASDGEVIEVLSGLAEGQNVVIVGKSSLRDKAPVMLSQDKE